MTFRTLALRSGVLSTALLVAACGGSGPTAGPTQAPAPTEAAPTMGPLPTLDLGSFELPSFVLPSFSSDVELEAKLPDTIGGVPVLKQSLSGEDFLAIGMGGGAALEPMLGEFGASVDDLSVAFGSAGMLVVIAYQIDGVPADRLFAGLEQAFQAGGAGGTVTQTTVAGRPVTEVRTQDETTYIYLADDVVFVIGGEVTPELLQDAVSQLPA